jgi:hypothetical protein
VAKAYLTALELDANQEEDVGDEMQTPQNAWPRVMGSFGASALDVTYCPEAHGVELRERAGSGNQSAFVDWYVRIIFATDEDADADAEEGKGEGVGGLRFDEAAAGAGTDGSSSKAPKRAPATGSLEGVKWAVAPTSACSVAGKMWKCSKCYVLNSWEQVKCLARESAAPHVVELAPAVTPDTAAAPSPAAGSISS